MPESKKKNSLKLELIALADNVISDQSNKLSIIGIFDKIFVKEVPASHSVMNLVMTFIGVESSKNDVKVKIENPSGKTVFEATLEVMIGQNGKANFVNKFEGFPIDEIGNFVIFVTHANNIIGKYVLEVLKLTQEDKDGGKIVN